MIYQIIATHNPQDFFEGIEPEDLPEYYEATNENLIEMLNQHQTYLVTLKAVEYLLNKYPEKSFFSRFGNIAGYDVESTDGEVIAECFAAVNFRNNQKLDKDLEKLDSVNRNVSCYEFFYDKVFEHKDYALYKTKFPGIQIVKFENLK